MLITPELSLGELEMWVRKLFWGEGSERYRISEEAFDWALEIMKKNFVLAKNDMQKEMILRKILHTKEVVEAGVDIIEETGEVDWDQYQAGTVCFLHDVGRFPQALTGSYSDEKSGVDHAKLGAEMIRKFEFPETKEMGVDLEVVADAVEWHSKRYYTGSSDYSKLCRDADKLGLMRFVNYHLDDYSVPNGEVTKAALENFLDGESVLRQNMVQRIDVYIAWLSWWHDLQFDATRRFIVSDGIVDFMLDKIKRQDVQVWEKMAPVLVVDKGF